MEAAWVSSKSRLCASEPLASTASGGEAVRLAPITVQSPEAPQPSSMPRIDGAVVARGSGQGDPENVERPQPHARHDVRRQRPEGQGRRELGQTPG